MEMRAGAEGGATGAPDGLPLRHGVAHGHGPAREVPVERRESAGVLHDDVIAVAAAGVTAGKGHLSRRRGDDRRAVTTIEADVDTSVRCANSQLRNTESLRNRALYRPDEPC